MLLPENRTRFTIFRGQAICPTTHVALKFWKIVRLIFHNWKSNLSGNPRICFPSLDVISSFECYSSSPFHHSQILLTKKAWDAKIRKKVCYWKKNWKLISFQFRVLFPPPICFFRTPCEFSRCVRIFLFVIVFLRNCSWSDSLSIRHKHHRPRSVLAVWNTELCNRDKSFRKLRPWLKKKNHLFIACYILPSPFFRIPPQSTERTPSC